jgi:hypothetical protein
MILIEINPTIKGMMLALLRGAIGTFILIILSSIAKKLHILSYIRLNRRKARVFVKRVFKFIFRKN